MNARRALIIVIVALIAFGVYWSTRSAGEDKALPRRATPSATTAAHMDPVARPDAGAKPAHTADERAALLAAIATARSHREAATSPSGGTATATASPSGSGTTLDITDRTGDNSAWEKRALGTLNALLGECYDLGRTEDPKLEGMVVLRFTLVGEPKVGGLLERVDIVEESTTIQQQTLRECMTQSLYALELDPPSDGVHVERELSLKFP